MHKFNFSTVRYLRERVFSTLYFVYLLFILPITLWFDKQIIGVSKDTKNMINSYL